MNLASYRWGWGWGWQVGTDYSALQTMSCGYAPYLASGKDKSMFVKMALESIHQTHSTSGKAIMVACTMGMLA